MGSTEVTNASLATDGIDADLRAAWASEERSRRAAASTPAALEASRRAAVAYQRRRARGWAREARKAQTRSHATHVRYCVGQALRCRAEARSLVRTGNLARAIRAEHASPSADARRALVVALDACPSCGAPAGPCPCDVADEGASWVIEAGQVVAP